MFLYAATIFLSAFLLFLVQPVIAKQILPWFGGAAAVWATCLVFFQSVLLFGYAYSDWKPRVDGGDPILAILGLLGVTIGLPYFLLSTTSPLVQAWFWQRFRHAVPYRLFALSNLASLLALLSYPALIEPF